MRDSEVPMEVGAMASHDEREAMRFLSSASFREPEHIVLSAWLEHAPFAFWIVDQLNPRTIVELGTGQGFSYLAFCQAVAANNEATTRCYAVDHWEGDIHTGSWSEDVFEDVQRRHGVYDHFSTLMRMSFDEAASSFGEGTIDLLHIDGLHTYEAVRHDIDTWLPRMSDRGVLLLHDTAVTDRGFGVGRAFGELRTTYPSFEFLHGHGLGVVGVGDGLPPIVRDLLAIAAEPVRDEARHYYGTLGRGVAHRQQAEYLVAELAAQEHDRSVVVRKIGELEERFARSKADVLVAQNFTDDILRSTSWRVTAPLRALSRRIPRLGEALRVGREMSFGKAASVLARRRAKLSFASPEPTLNHDSQTDDSYDTWIEAYDVLDDEDLCEMSSYAARLESRPRLSILMPVFNPSERYLREAIESVRSQVYERWQLCISDAGSTEPYVREVLDGYERSDERIVVVYRPNTDGISSAANSALDVADGDFVGLLDHEDVLRPHALLLVATEIQACPEAAYIYSDEDKIDRNGVRFGHYFKPDWNPTLLLCQNYVSRFSVLRSDFVRQVGGFRSAYEGNQDWDLALRVTELIAPDRVRHIPHVLYHRRATSTPTAAGSDAKPYAIDAARRAVADHFARTGRRGYSVPAENHYQTPRFFLTQPPPKVSVLIPSTGRRDLIGPCIEGLRRRTTYAPLEIIVALGGQLDAPLDGRPLKLASSTEVDAVLRLDEPFNFSRSINVAAKAATGSILLLLNDDVDVLHPDWLKLMVGHVLSDGAAVVGPMLIYPDGTIQHAGVLLSREGPHHLYHGRSFDTAGYVNRARLPQDISAVTGACMLVRRDVFDEVGGMREDLPGAYNDIDFCLRIRSTGRRVVYVPDAVLYHRESASFGSHYEGRRREYAREVGFMWRHWATAFERDPMHNPNLALNGADPSELAFPPRVHYPWRNRGGRS